MHRRHKEPVVACEGCATCESYAGKPSTWIKGHKCATCGHVRCPKAPPEEPAPEATIGNAQLA